MSLQEIAAAITQVWDKQTEQMKRGRFDDLLSEFDRI